VRALRNIVYSSDADRGTAQARWSRIGVMSVSISVVALALEVLRAIWSTGT